jgi:hypothetical protein
MGQAVAPGMPVSSVAPNPQRQQPRREYCVGCCCPAAARQKPRFNALTLVLAGGFAGTGVFLNSVCLGWVATHMGGRGSRRLHDGAASVVRSAMLLDDGRPAASSPTASLLAW